MDTNKTLDKHIFFMQEALKQCEIAIQKNEVPIGCIIALNDKIIAKSHNLSKTLNDPTAHAEIISIGSASNYLGTKYLNECSLYVTLEPCVMCAGALFWSKIKEVFFAANDKNRGFTNFNINLHPKTKVESGIMSKQASKIIKNFFSKKR